MQRISTFTVMAAVVAVATAAYSAAESDLEILTRPPGLVAGELEIEVSLGGGGQRAELYLDGDPACTLTAADPRCMVDLGEELHVHLLELVGQDGGGRVTERVSRWLNQPGREADLAIQLAARPVGDTCGGRLRWSDHDGQNPVLLEVEAAGQRWEVTGEGSTFSYPCPVQGRTRVLGASAIFPDGRRAEAAVLVDDSGRPVEPAPTAVALEAKSGEPDPCMAVEAEGEGWVLRAEREGLEVVFVLDPGADYRALASLERRAGKDARSSWDDAGAAFRDADSLWFVAPDDGLRRIDGFAESISNWLGVLFQLGPAGPASRPRLADAVATAGLMAAAGPRRRAVVLILGSEDRGDGSRFRPEQARSHLAEVGVPLVVLRSGGGRDGRDDGWPEGMEVSGIASLADAFASVRARLGQQCVEWFPSAMHPNQIVASLPEGVTLAGRERRTGSAAVSAVWRRAAVVEGASGGLPISDEPVASERIEVTAVTVLVSALDKKGHPVTDLAAGDLTLTEDGDVKPILELEAVRPLQPLAEQHPAPAQPAPLAPQPALQTVPVAVYVEWELAGSADIAPALAAVAERADWLTGLGPVDVAVAEGGVETVLEGAVDAALVRETLMSLARKPSRAHGIERIRTEYLRDIRKYPDRRAPLEGQALTSTPDNALRVKTMTTARSAIFQEDALLWRTMNRMNDWALSLPSSGPRVLVVIGMGFDEDPSDFYISFLERKDPSLAAAARAEFLRYHQAIRVEGVGRELAAMGWLVVPVATRTVGRARTGAEYPGGDRFQDFLTDRRDGAYIRDVDYMLLDPLGSQEHLAEPSGGRVVMGGKGMDRLIAEATGWYRLTYQVARAPDGAYHDVAVVSRRPDVKVRGTGVVVSGTSEGRAAMRLRRLFVDSQDRGELPVTLALGAPRPGEGKSRVADLTVTVNFGPIAPLFRDGGSRVLRFSVAVRSGESESTVVHQLATVDGAVGGFRYEIPLEWSKKDPTVVAVVVEDLGSGVWGGNVEELVD
ncbi:MAG: hypothetical protein ACC742_11360 [Thermoanaerobaculales bacterium]